MSTPNAPGQLVISTVSGVLGITTDAPRARTPRIGVIFIGSPYSVVCDLSDLKTVSPADLRGLSL